MESLAAKGCPVTPRLHSNIFSLPDPLLLRSGLGCAPTVTGCFFPAQSSNSSSPCTMFTGHSVATSWTIMDRLTPAQYCSPFTSPPRPAGLFRNMRKAADPTWIEVGKASYCSLATPMADMSQQGTIPTPMYCVFCFQSTSLDKLLRGQNSNSNMNINSYLIFILRAS